MSSEFEKLAAELETLAKAQPASEEDKVLAAAKDAGVDTAAVGEDAAVDGGGAPAGDGDGAAGDGDGDGDGDEVLGKSFDVVGDDGQTVKAYDATELIKSMSDRIVELETGFADVAERREHLGKSLGLMTDLIKSQSAQITKQAEQLETLQKSVAALGNQGAGRKAILTLNEKPELALAKSSQPDGVSGKDLLAKAEAGLLAGRLTASDVSRTEAYLNKGMSPPADLVSRVMGNQ